MTVSEKAAYLKGMLAGMKIGEDTDEGKVFQTVADLLEDLALSVADLEDEVAAMRDYIDEMDNDLSAVESDLYDDWDFDDDDDDDDDEDVDHDCENCNEEECVIGLDCPACGNTIYSEACELARRDTLVCPSCGQVLNITCDEDEEEDEEDAEEEAKAETAPEAEEAKADEPAAEPAPTEE